MKLFLTVLSILVSNFSVIAQNTCDSYLVKKTDPLDGKITIDSKRELIFINTEKTKGVKFYLSLDKFHLYIMMELVGVKPCIGDDVVMDVFFADSTQKEFKSIDMANCKKQCTIGLYLPEDTTILNKMAKVKIKGIKFHAGESTMSYVFTTEQKTLFRKNIECVRNKYRSEF